MKGVMRVEGKHVRELLDEARLGLRTIDLAERENQAVSEFRLDEKLEKRGTPMDDLFAGLSIERASQDKQNMEHLGNCLSKGTSKTEEPTKGELERTTGKPTKGIKNTPSTSGAKPVMFR